MSLQEWKRYFTDMPGLDALVGRVSTSGRKPVFMVGSGLSLPEEQGGPGVPGAAGMIDLIRSRLSDDQAALDALNRRLDQVAKEDASVYGAAFELLNAWRGQDAVNKVVSDAVLGARLPGARQSEDPRMLEEDLEGWTLNRGTRALGSLLAGHRESYPEPAVLTTNFDPLVSIAINRANGHSHPIFLNGDHPLPPMARLMSDETPVMHLHGYWRGVDTQHTWMELTASRPQLGASLARLLYNRLVVVVGYEGWDDAFMRAVALLLADPVAQPDIVWAVYDDDPGKLFDRHAALMDHFEEWRDRPRFKLYAGINGNEFFQRLLDRANGSPGPTDTDTQSDVGTDSRPTIAPPSKPRQADSTRRERDVDQVGEQGAKLSSVPDVQLETDSAAPADCQLFTVQQPDSSESRLTKSQPKEPKPQPRSGPGSARVISTLAGHDGGVSSLAFSPDGSLLASAGLDGTVRLWTVATGAELDKLPDYAQAAGRLAFSQDGRLLAFAGHNASVILWEWEEPDLPRSLEGRTGQVSSVAFSWDGSLLAYASESETVGIWEIGAGSRHDFTSHKATVRDVAFSPEGQLLASAGGYDQTVRLWNIDTDTNRWRFNLDTQTPAHILTGHAGMVTRVAFSPNGNLLASAGANIEEALIPGIRGKTLPAFRQGRTDRTVRLWDVSTGSLVQTLKGHTDGVQDVAFSPDGRLLASAALDRTVRLWDVSNDEKVHTLPRRISGVPRIAFSPGGDLLAAAGSDARSIHLFTDFWQ